MTNSQKMIKSLISIKECHRMIKHIKAKEKEIQQTLNKKVSVSCEIFLIDELGLIHTREGDLI